MPLVSEWLRTLYIWGFCHLTTRPPPSDVFIWVGVLGWGGGGGQTGWKNGWTWGQIHTSISSQGTECSTDWTYRRHFWNKRRSILNFSDYSLHTVVNLLFFVCLFVFFLELWECHFTKMCILPCFSNCIKCTSQESTGLLCRSIQCFDGFTNMLWDSIYRGKLLY